MPGFIEAVEARLWRGSLMETLGIHLTEVSAEHVVSEVALRPGLEQLSGAGMFHGGVLMTLADVTSAVTCIHALDPTGADASIPFAPLIQLNASIVGNSRRGKAIGESRLMSKTRSLMTVETTVRDDAGRLLVLATSMHFVVAGG